MPFTILPRIGLVGLSLGASKSEVRNFFGERFLTSSRTYGAVPCDFWPDVCVFANYSRSDVLVAVEFTSPAELTLDGISMFELSPRDALLFLQQRDSNLVMTEHGTSLTSNVLGVGVWMPNLGDPDEEEVEAIIVFKDGYYDD